jgi:hypothetical protein
VLLFGACVAEDVDPTAMGGSGGSGTSNGGSAGQTGNTGGGGGSGMGGGGAGGGGGVTGDPEFGIQIECVPPTQTLIADFSPVAAPVADAGADGGADAAAPAPGPNYSFGDFYLTFSGGTYVYPTGGAYPVTSDISGNNWHISGEIGDYSGFGLYFGGTFAPETRACTVVDMSAYDGIQFTVSGSVAMGNMLTMSVAIARNNVSHVWLNTVAMPPPNPPAERNAGRCIPASTNQFDGSCASPSTTVAVTADPTTITLLWSDFTNGLPDAAINPEEITGIAWAFPAPPGAGTTTPAPYAADIVIDDIRLVDNP